MSQLKIARVSALPTPLVANTIYLLQVSASELQVVTVGNTAADVRSSIIGTDVDGKITASVGALNTTLSQAIADAIVTASNDATAKADAAEADAIAAAAADATAKAAAAQAAAIGVAAGDATTKADAALATANIYTDRAVSAAIGDLDLSNSAQLVDDIAARDALAPTLTKNSFVLVSDASADATVDVGAALYFYNTADESFLKIAEYESLDFVLPNRAILEALSVMDGKLAYNGALVGTVQAGANEW